MNMSQPEPGNRDAALTAALRALAEDDATVGASPAVEARLLEEVRVLAEAANVSNVPNVPSMAWVDESRSDAQDARSGQPEGLAERRARSAADATTSAPNSVNAPNSASLSNSPGVGNVAHASSGTNIVGGDSAARMAKPWDAEGLASVAVASASADEDGAMAQSARRRGLVMAAAVFAIAAALVLFVIGPSWRARQSVRPPQTNVAAEQGDATAERPAEAATAFLPLIYSNVPITNGQVVRMEVPRAALASFGLASIDIRDGASAGTVLADVLVGDDGLARAVRFVRAAAARQKERKE
jgi:hypothetical protein